MPYTGLPKGNKSLDQGLSMDFAGRATNGDIKCGSACVIARAAVLAAAERAVTGSNACSDTGVVGVISQH